MNRTCLLGITLISILFSSAAFAGESEWTFIGPITDNAKNGAYGIGGKPTRLYYFNPNSYGSPPNSTGLFRSEDAGLSWQSVTLPSVSNDQSHVYSYRMSVDPTDGLIVYLFEYQLATGGIQLTSKFRSQDGGLTWDVVDNSPDDGVPPQQLIVDPTNPNNQWKLTLQGPAHSTDGGKTWQLIVKGDLRGQQWQDLSSQSIFLDPQNPKTVFVNVTQSNEFGSVSVNGLYEYTSPDSNQTALKGDMNNDGKVDIADAVKVLRIAVGLDKSVNSSS